MNCTVLTRKTGTISKTLLEFVSICGTSSLHNQRDTEKVKVFEDFGPYPIIFLLGHIQFYQTQPKTSTGLLLYFCSWLFLMLRRTDPRKGCLPSKRLLLWGDYKLDLWYLQNSKHLIEWPLQQQFKEQLWRSNTAVFRESDEVWETIPPSVGEPLNNLTILRHL